MSNISENSVEEVEVSQSSNHFDKLPLMVSFIILGISVIPVYLTALDDLIESGGIGDKNIVESLIENDVLWVFSTSLLFAILNASLTTLFGKRVKSISKCFPVLFFTGIFLFITAESTWLLLDIKFDLVRDNEAVYSWILGIESFWIVSVVVVQTLLQIDVIRHGE